MCNCNIWIRSLPVWLSKTKAHPSLLTPVFYLYFWPRASRVRMCALAIDEAGMVVSWCSSSSSLWKHKAGWFIASYWEHKSHLQRRAFKRPASWQHLPFINDWAEPPMEPETTKLTHFPTNSSFCFTSLLSLPPIYIWNLRFLSFFYSPPHLPFPPYTCRAWWEVARGSVRVSGG